MSAGIFIIGAGVVAAAWLLSRRLAWSDARPGLAPLSVFGDWPAVPAEYVVEKAATRKTGGEGLHRAAASTRTNDIAHRGSGN